MTITNKDRRRFWMLVFFTDKDKCWHWHGARRKPFNDYGMFKLNGRTVKAHRFALASIARYNFDLDSELVLMHTCDRPNCVNPEHLIPVSQRENIQDCIRKGRFESINNLMNGR